MKGSSSTERVVIAAAMTAAVFVGTFVIRIPIPATGGYLNLGDPVIQFAALAFGPVVGMIAGGIGSAAADLVGFPAFAIPTLVIKGLMGGVVGLIGYRGGVYRAWMAAIVGELIMISGYFAVEAVVFRESMGVDAAISEVWFNLAQGVFGVVLGCSAYFLLIKRDGSDGKG